MALNFTFVSVNYFFAFDGYCCGLAEDDWAAFGAYVADNRNYITQCLYIVLAALPVLLLVVKLAGVLEGRPNGAPAREEVRVVRLFRLTALLTLFFVSFHKMNADFLNPVVSCEEAVVVIWPPAACASSLRAWPPAQCSGRSSSPWMGRRDAVTERKEQRFFSDTVIDAGGVSRLNRPSHMTKLTLSILSVVALAGSAAAEVAYEFVPNFITPPTGKETIGNGHGEIAVDSAGNIYVSVQEKDAGIQVYGPDGKFQKALKLPQSLHGFVIRKDGDGEYLFAAVLGEQKVIKAKLDGEVVMTIPTSEFPADKVGKGLKLTNCDVAPNGDIYVVDGYGADWIFVFGRDGKFKKVFGGRVPPLSLTNAHKIFVDRRFEPARLMICDRGHKRMLHTDLDGNFIAEIAKDMRNPSSASFHGDLMCVAEIAGNVSVWDKENKRVADLGTAPKLTNTPKIEPKDWQQGVVTSPHGITFDNEGNILETEWNQWGRVLKWKVKK